MFYRVAYAIAGVLMLLAAAGFVNAGYYDGYGDQPSSSFGVNVEVTASGYSTYSPGYSTYTHYCYPYGAYSVYCRGYSPSYLTPYCDPFDPYYYVYCAYPYYGLYPTYYVNPGRIIYAGGNGNNVYANPYQPPQPQAPPCSDGTLPGTCSSNYPKYCLGIGNASQLIDKATLCGCPEGQVRDENNRNRCATATCSDGTPVNTCSTSKPKFCTSNSALVDRPSQCGCPSGSKLEGNSCVALDNTCFISSVSPRTVRQGQSAGVVVEYSEVQNPTGYVQCGDGQSASLSCQRRADGLRGSCTATCTYTAFSEQPRVLRAFLGGNSCAGSSSVNVIPPQSATGAALVKVTSCSSGVSIPGATVSAAGLRVTANSRGEAEFPALNSGVYSVFVSKNGYNSVFSTLVVNSQSPGAVELCLEQATAPVCVDCNSTTSFSPSVETGISLEVLGSGQRVANSGEVTCFDFLARNRASEAADVSLTAVSFPNARVELSQERFILSAGQVKNLRACLTVPEGVSNSFDLKLRAVSAINDAFAFATVNTAPAMGSDARGCFEIGQNYTQFSQVTVTNNGRTGSYVARLSTPADFGARLVQENLFNFHAGDLRQVSIQVDPFNAPGQQRRAVLSIFDKVTNAKVFEKELCFSSNVQERFDSIAFVSPNRVSVEVGKTAHVFMHVRNTGNSPDTFELDAVSPFAGVALLQRRLYLEPGQEKSFEVELTPVQGVEEGTYTLPIQVYSLRRGLRSQVALDTLVVDVLNEVPSTPLQVVKVGEAKVEFISAPQLIKVAMNVSNRDSRATVISPSLEGLPEGWSYRASPVQAIVPQFSSVEFTFEITPSNLQSRDYNVTAVFTDEFGRQAKEAIVLPAKSSSWLTGFFVLGTANQFLGFIVLLLVLAGLYLIYRSWEMHREIQQEQQGLRG